MAEIKIEKKKPIWPWILLTLVILGIVAYLVLNNDKYDDDVDDFENDTIEDTRMNTDQNDSTLYESTIYDPNSGTEDSQNAMAELMAAMQDSSRFGMDTTYTKTALHNLSKITVGKAEQYNIDASTALSNLKDYNNESATMSVANMNMNEEFKKYSQHIVTVIEAIQAKDMPSKENEVTNLKQTSSKLNATSDLATQQSTIQIFFRQAHDLLHSMNSKN